MAPNQPADVPVLLGSLAAFVQPPFDWQVGARVLCVFVAHEMAALEPCPWTLLRLHQGTGPCQLHVRAAAIATSACRIAYHLPTGAPQWQTLALSMPTYLPWALTQRLALGAANTRLDTPLTSAAGLPHRCARGAVPRAATGGGRGGGGGCGAVHAGCGGTGKGEGRLVCCNGGKEIRNKCWQMKGPPRSGHGDGARAWVEVRWPHAASRVSRFALEGQASPYRTSTAALLCALPPQATRLRSWCLPSTGESTWAS